jgi:hypothetical protein
MLNNYRHIGLQLTFPHNYNSESQRCKSLHVPAVSTAILIKFSFPKLSVLLGAQVSPTMGTLVPVTSMDEDGEFGTTENNVWSARQ